MKSQGDSPLPTDGHKAILNKLNSKSKANRKRTNIDNENKPEQGHRLGTVSSKLLVGMVGGGWGLNRFYAASTLALGSVLRCSNPRPRFSCGYKCFRTHVTRNNKQDKIRRTDIFNNLVTSISKMNHSRSNALERSVIVYWGT